MLALPDPIGERIDSGLDGMPAVTPDPAPPNIHPVVYHPLRARSLTDPRAHLGPARSTRVERAARNEGRWVAYSSVTEQGASIN